MKMKTPARLALAALAAAGSTGADAQRFNGERPTQQEIDRTRQLIRQGRLDIRRVALADVLDEIMPMGRGFTTTGAAHRDATLGNPNPWAALIGPTDFHEGFESYDKHISLASETDYVPLAGQTAPHGADWQTVHISLSAMHGVVDNAIAQTGPNWNPSGTDFFRQGVVGGPDPQGERSAFFASPRGTVEPQPHNTSNQFVARLDHALYYLTDDEPVVTVLIDWYKDDITSLSWWRPASNTEGFILTNVFLGGYDIGNFAAFVNQDNILDRIVVLADRGTPGQGDFFGAADGHVIRDREWFNLGIRLSVATNNPWGSRGMSVWVRDSSTIGVYAFEDDSVYDAFPGDPTKGAFAGEVFKQDWLQVFPGVENDPNTTLLEGNGGAYNFFQQIALVAFDTTGSPVSPQGFTASVDMLAIVSGSDPIPTDVPGYQPRDFYADNYTVFGHREVVPGCPGDLNGDNAVDGTDLGLLLLAWGTDDTLADLSGDGVVDGTDLGQLLLAWGPCP